MKKIYCLLFITNFFIVAAFAQDKLLPVHFKNGDFPGNKNFQKGKLAKDFFIKTHFEKKNYALVQFNTIPGINERKELLAKGVLLFDYVPGNAFMTEMPDSINFTDLKNYGVQGLYNVDRQFKISKSLLQHLNEGHPDGSKLIAVSFFGTITKKKVIEELIKSGANIIDTKIKPAHVVFIKTPAQVLEKIAAMPFVTYLSEHTMKDMPLNYNNRSLHALDALNSISGRNLQGKNVTLGIGDNGDPSTHIDFAGRLILRIPAGVANHGTHTAGTLAGAGILNQRFKGMAPQATIVSQYYSDILVNTPTYINDYGMIITNNSYYSGADYCPGDGEYDVLSNFADDQLYTYDSLVHTFAAGNDGYYTCSPFPSSYGTIKSGFQCGKNVLSVGAMSSYDYTIADFSSRGPVNDGRIKPEIVAGGVDVASTFPYNTYNDDYGTSMASPTVAGTLGLLYERYRQLHGGSNPSGALIKAVACNGADDKGNPGPDYLFGFGMLNARNAVEALENNHYFTGSLTNGNSTNFTISGVPSGAQQIKIMLYWTDPAGAPNAASSLVNNLDLTVSGSDAVIHHPLILNPNPGHVNDIAVEGIDSNNNIEQVVINNPPAGNFTITVNGKSIPSGAQNFVVVYQILNPSVILEYPYGNESWVPGQQENIRWSAYGGNGNTFTLEYSLNNGSTWTTISNTIADSLRFYYGWVVPDTATSTAQIRITRNNVGYTSTNKYNFTIIGQPVVSVTNPCQGYAQLVWNKIPSATNYEIMMLTVDTMRTIASTTDTSFLISGLNRDSSYWLTVRAMINGTPGIRALAGNITPNGGACTLIAKDFTTDSLISPTTGRQFTSTQLSNATNMQVEIKNLGNAASVNPFTISYQVNGGSIITETSPAVINANAAFNYTFTTPVDFSAVGTYNAKIWVNYPGDTLHTNDTLNVVVKQLQNDTISLNPAFTEGFENAAAAAYTNNAFGFTGLDRCDFNLSNSNGRARTFVNTGFARTGDRCVTLDQSHYNAASTADSLITTFNLSNYSSADQLWLDFFYKNHGIDFSLPGNQIWIRGNDQAAWIPVLTLPSTNQVFGIYQSSGGIDITGTLANASPAQTVSSSFQVKFGEQGYTSANSVIPDSDLDDGFSFDDVTITKSANDVGLSALISPNLTAICNLSNAETIAVKVRNYSTDTLRNIAVSYAINGNAVTENIPVLAPKDSLIYTFSQKADLSAFGTFNIGTWVNYPTDNYHTNDSLLNIIFQTTPVISTYPYLEGFENGNGYWYTNGVNDSWQWGTPQKTIINKAANGSKAWVTNLTGDYNSNELSYLYSPCFDLSSLAKPVLSFSHIFQTEDDCDCDYHWAEYTTDNINWIKLGAVGNGTNWYDNANKQAWQLSDTIWHVSSYDIPVNAAKVRFRIVMSSDPATTYEGIGIDDVHVFDKASVYKGANIDAGITQNVSGTDWINFTVDTNIVAAINPNGQNLGSTTVKVFIDTTIKHTSNQYYLNRNIVIQPTNKATDSVSVRFYFLDSETDSLINATGCTTCTSIHDAYQSGVTQYSSTVQTEEDSTLNNNAHGLYRYIRPYNQVSIIPNDNGYYAEYKVAGFSEFWINGGGTTQDQALGTTLQNFTVTKVDTTALLQWSTLHEINIDSFIIERSSDSVHFFAIGSVNATGDSTTTSNYQFTDNNLLAGINYYQLKIINADGSIQYSSIQSINNTANTFVIGIYPNPITANTILHINTSSNCNFLQLSDVAGRIIKTATTSGFQNTLAIDNLSKGVYMLVVNTDAGKKVAKVVVE
jgi:subtilase family protein/type IX secretion system substrate protein